MADEPPEFDLRAHIEELIQREPIDNNILFPDLRTFETDFLAANVPQISLEKSSACVHCKITDDFATMQQYTLDEDSIPPKILCWNDLSALDTKSATKSVKAGLESEYKSILDDMTISFQSVSTGNTDPIEVDTKEQLIYHVLDPALTQKSRINSVSVNPNRLKMSRSSLFLKQSQDTPVVRAPPIQEDMEGLVRLADSVPEDTIFIFDCSHSNKCLNAITERNIKVFVLSATSDTLMYSPRYPCDLFSSCILTPARVALLMDGVGGDFSFDSDTDAQSLINTLASIESSDIIKTLEAALVGYADAIASTSLENDNSTFRRCFRKDALTARLFAGFLFAQRTMKAVSTTPISYPPLPDLSKNDIWNRFDFQVDRALFHLKSLTKPPVNRPISLYEEFLEETTKQLENWLEFPKRARPAPVELSLVFLLLESPKFVDRAVRFCARFTEIAVEQVFKLLNTRAFPALLGKPITEDYVKLLVNCVTTSPVLSVHLDERISRFVDAALNAEGNLETALLCLLLFFADAHVQKYSVLQKRLEECTKSDNEDQRTLSHLILVQMGVGFSAPYPNVASEGSPHCRAAMISRMNITLASTTVEAERAEIFFTMMSFINDLCPLVREQVIKLMSTYIYALPDQTLQKITSVIKEGISEDPAISLIGHALEMLQLDPSTRVSKTVHKLYNFLAAKLENREIEPIHAAADDIEIMRVIHSRPEPSFRGSQSRPLTVHEGPPLIGTPIISQACYLGCGDASGVMHSHVGNGSITEKFDFFSPPDFSAPDYFSELRVRRQKMRQTINFSTFVEEEKILAVSSRGQVTVINTQKKNDNDVAFCLGDSTAIRTDYNCRTSQLLSTTAASASLIDMQKLQQAQTIRLGRQQVFAMGFLKPYETLFYVAQDDFRLFDIRLRQPVAVLEHGGSGIVGCNSSGAMPFYMIAASHRSLWMSDLRMMTPVASRAVDGLTQFDVHPLHPFGVGKDNSGLSVFSFEDGLLQPTAISSGCDGFCLHPSRTMCAVRNGSAVVVLPIDY